ncbi:helix-turn-helix domain-containing protein [Chitinophaga sancti]|uniref:AraC family transcriptional regulator n=1 Tax=Chitinophaga sancti TaxID=1004 RepID=A0A1K1S2E0_9BACT|nr:AraC family transcriptional regulator [Chitinophaga sancti]WQD59668.1 AraC family transcriptional regulator [Chitinophaga sancti]WQG88201.1 AraC family transcriptional regulator [Chitinophaga sancti]SFW78346.1 AraC-type DNA-binding protein [Chitinophaga sancti]
MGSFLQQHTQNNKLPIRIVSPTFGSLETALMGDYTPLLRKPYYFLLFVLEGTTRHGIDLQQFDVTADQLLFVLPHQIHHVPDGKKGTNFFKLGFDESSLSLLPRQYPFLINPLNNQKIQFSPAAAARLKSIFEMLLGLLSRMDTDPELILAHLNSLLTEINAAYFAVEKRPANDRLSAFIRFKLLIENNLTEHPSIIEIAEELALNPNSLYNMVKQYSGLSPKEFITNRLILEAKRRLYYNKQSSIKELAYELGFNDPEYFSRLFKKVTGQTIGEFVQDLSGN